MGVNFSSSTSAALISTSVLRSRNRREDKRAMPRRPCLTGLHTETLDHYDMTISPTFDTIKDLICHSGAISRECLSICFVSWFTISDTTGRMSGPRSLLEAVKKLKLPIARWQMVYGNS